METCVSNTCDLFSDIRQTSSSQGDRGRRDVPRRGDDQDLAGLEQRALCLPHLADHSRPRDRRGQPLLPVKSSCPILFMNAFYVHVVTYILEEVTLFTPTKVSSYKMHHTAANGCMNRVLQLS